MNSPQYIPGDAPKVVTFAEAANTVIADAKLRDYVGQEITIKEFRSEDRSYGANASKISYIRLTNGQILFHWGDVIADQLMKIQKALDRGDQVKAKVVAKTKKGTFGQAEPDTYIVLE